ncbi:MAG: hypothetical protein AABX61_00065 [Nanoarchaeota archaeon]
MKKGSFEWTLVRILFILVVLLVILISGGRILWDAGKSALQIFGLINITQTDYSQLNKDAKFGFDSFVKDIQACKNPKDNDCLCYTSLFGFSEIHQVEITNNEIRLVNIKDGNNLLMNKQTIQDFNCYYNKNGLNAEPKLIINFDGKLPRINKKIAGIGFIASDINFNYNSAIYKSNKVCLISTDFSPGSIKVCKI